MSKNKVRLIYKNKQGQMKIKVCNALNTSEYDKIEGMACIDYWDENVKCRTYDKSVCRKSKEQASEDDIIVGAHVIGYTSQGLRVFIVPMLRSNNNAREDLDSFEVEEDDLVRIPNEEDEKKILLDKDNQQQISTVFGSKTLQDFLNSIEHQQQ